MCRDGTRDPGRPHSEEDGGGQNTTRQQPALPHTAPDLVDRTFSLAAEEQGTTRGL